MQLSSDLAHLDRTPQLEYGWTGLRGLQTWHPGFTLQEVEVGFGLTASPTCNCRSTDAAGRLAASSAVKEHIRASVQCRHLAQGLGKDF